MRRKLHHFARLRITRVVGGELMHLPSGRGTVHLRCVAEQHIALFRAMNHIHARIGRLVHARQQWLAEQAVVVVGHQVEAAHADATAQVSTGEIRVRAGHGEMQEAAAP